MKNIPQNVIIVRLIFGVFIATVLFVNLPYLIKQLSEENTRIQNLAFETQDIYDVKEFQYQPYKFLTQTQTLYIHAEKEQIREIITVQQPNTNIRIAKTYGDNTVEYRTKPQLDDKPYASHLSNTSYYLLRLDPDTKIQFEKEYLKAFKKAPHYESDTQQEESQ